MDTAGHRLYVSRGTHVQVVDTDRDSLVGDIVNTAGVHGVTVAPSLGRGFTSNGRDCSVTVFDLKILAPISVVHGTGRNPDAIPFDEATKRVFTFNGGSATLAVKSHIALAGCEEPTGMGIDRARHRLYVGCGGNRAMSVVD